MMNDIKKQALLALAIAATSAQAATINYWRFEEATSGAIVTALDSVGSSNLTGTSGVTYAANTLFPNPVPLTSAANTGAASFTSPNSLVNPTFNLPNANFTIEMYFNAPWAGTNANDIFHLGTGAYSVRVWYSEGFLVTNTQGNDVENATIPLANNTTYHLAWTRTGNAMNCYVNGVLAMSNLSAPIWATGYDGFQLGSAGNNDFLTGFIDEVRISNEALAPSQFLNAAAVPEPASLALLGLGAVALLRRRRTA